MRPLFETAVLHQSLPFTTSHLPTLEVYPPQLASCHSLRAKNETIIPLFLCVIFVIQPQLPSGANFFSLYYQVPPHPHLPSHVKINKAFSLYIFLQRVYNNLELHNALCGI